MKNLRSAMILFASLTTITAIGCAKPPPEEAKPSAQGNKNADDANANAYDLSRTHLYSSTIRGDVERAGLAVVMAHDFVKQEKWPDAMAQLRAAQSQIEKALERNPRLRDDFEAARTAILKTIEAVEVRGGDVEQMFTETQTRIHTLKAYTSQQ